MFENIFFFYRKITLVYMISNLVSAGNVANSSLFSSTQEIPSQELVKGTSLKF
jgi:hypothetical protein